MPMRTPRPSREARLQWLDAQIRAARFPNAVHMAEELGISPRSAWKDFAHLRDDLHAPVKFDKVRDGWHYTDSTFALPLVYLTGEETSGLRRAYLAAREYLGEADAQPVRTVFEQWDAHSAVVDNGAAHKLARVTTSLGREIVSVGGAIRLTGTANVSPDRLREWHRAVYERCKLSLRYHGAHRDSVTERVVRPYHLHNERGEWYALAHCELRDALRTFLLGRIEEQAICSEPAGFAIPSDFDASALLSQGFHLKHGESSIRVVVDFDAYQARWIRERVYHETQTLEPLPNGGLRLTMIVAGLEEVKRWVLGYGSHAEVREPEALRTEIAGEIGRLQKIYK